MKVKDIFEIINTGEIPASKADLKKGDLVKYISVTGTPFYCKIYCISNYDEKAICGYWRRDKKETIDNKIAPGAVYPVKDCFKIMEV